MFATCPYCFDNVDASTFLLLTSSAREPTPGSFNAGIGAIEHKSTSVPVAARSCGSVFSGRGNALPPF